jgi:hypothetical protein
MKMRLALSENKDETGNMSIKGFYIRTGKGEFDETDRNAGTNAGY